ncbi:MAG: hypothetical protein WA862_02680 [Solirubrobacterales bacterium]
MALPVAMLATMAALALAGAAVTSTVDVQQSSHRDSSSKSAIAAADAGANVALLRLQRNSAELAESPCLEGSAPEADGWCPLVVGEVGGSEYRYRVSQAGAKCGAYDLCIISTGTAGSVSRRVEVTFTNSGGGTGGGGGGGHGQEGLIGNGDIQIDQNADARVGVGTNGNVYVENNGNVCGDIRHGVGDGTNIDETGGTQCDGYGITEEDILLPPVSDFMPTDIAEPEHNSNYRLAPCLSLGNPVGCELDTYSGKRKATIPWNPATRTITAFNNSTLTLGGEEPYFICKLELLNNSHLIMPEDAEVRIFFDTPENCHMSAGEKQIYISEGANITSTGYQPDEGKFAVLQLYVMGSISTETTVEWRPNSGTNELYLYAPNSHIELWNNALFMGTIVGNTIHLHQEAVVDQDDGYEPPDNGDPPGDPVSPPVYTAQYYVECSGEPTLMPDTGC